MNVVGKSILINPDTVGLVSDPIPEEWILDGTPQARVNKLLTSRDWNSTVVVWDCTPGSFKWHYSKDETVHFLSGEAYMTDETGEEHRFGAGDFVFFPAGTNCRWRVTKHIKKIAVVRETLWRPLGFIVKASNRLFRSDHWHLKTNSRPTNSMGTEK